MSATQKAVQFHTSGALVNGLRELLRQLELRLDLQQPVNVFLAGGMAVLLGSMILLPVAANAEDADLRAINNRLKSLTIKANAEPIA